MISYMAFEGMEGAGKSTVMAAVEEVLHDRGVPGTTVREPGAHRAGEQGREMLLAVGAE